MATKFIRSKKAELNSIFEKTKKLYLSSLPNDEIEFDKSEMENSKKVKYLFPYKEFREFLLQADSHEISTVLSSIYKGESLQHIDNDELRQGILYYICHEHYDLLNADVKARLDTYLEDLIQIIRKKLPYIPGSHKKIRKGHNFSCQTGFVFIEPYLINKALNHFENLNIQRISRKYEIEKLCFKNKVDFYYRLDPNIKDTCPDLTRGNWRSFIAIEVCARHSHGLQYCLSSESCQR